MNKKNIINVKVRMNLDREEDKEAWDNLRHLDRKKHKSYSRAFIKAINYFSEKEQRSKEDRHREKMKEWEELLRLISKEVHSSVWSALSTEEIASRMKEAMKGDAAQPEPKDDVSQEKEALMDEALDFVNGF